MGEEIAVSTGEPAAGEAPPPEVLDVLAQENASQVTDLEAGRAMVGVTDPYRPIQPMRQSAPPHAREADTLEDLYSLHPKLGAGEWKVRVERLQPRTFNGVPVTGVIDDFSERMSIDQFKRRYGGSVYLLRVMKPTEDEGNTEGSYVTVKTIKIRVPGAPTGIGMEEADMFNNGQVRVIGGSDPSVEKARLDADLRREEMMREELRARDSRLAEQSRTPDEVMSHFQQASSAAIGAIERSASSTTEMWQKEAAALRLELREREVEVNKLRDAMVVVKTEANEKMRDQETVRIQQLQTAHATELSQLRAQYQDSSNQQKERYDERIAALNMSAAKELDSARREAAIERERSQTDHSSRYQQMNDAYRREIDNLRETYDRRVEDLKSSSTSENKFLRDRLESEVSNVRENERTRAELQIQTAHQQVQLLRDERNRLDAENQRLKAQLEVERAKQIKDPLVALEESEKMARYTGMVRPEEVTAPAEESTFATVAKTVGPQLMEVLGRMAGPRPQQMQPQVQYLRPGQQAQQQVRSLPQQQMRQQPQQQPQQQRQPLVRPQQQQQPAVSMPIASAQPRVSNVAMPLGSHTSAPVVVPQAAAPIQRQVVPTSSVETPAPVTELVNAGATPGEQRAPLEQLAPQQQMGGSEQLLDALEAAINAKAKPQEFVDYLRQAVGPAEVKSMLGQAKPDDVIGWLGQMPNALAVNTRDGRRFVAESIRIIQTP
jgi:hypothetical protein